MPGLRGLRVLVVEDSLLLADALCDLLQEHGLVPVGPAASVETAVDLVVDGTPIDAAIVDVRLRGGTSVALWRVLQEQDIPFLLLTGSSGGDVPVPPGVPRLDKPCDPEALLKALQRMLRRPRAAGGAYRLDLPA
jgi:DNA-binding response OmpR family regulator